MLNSSFEKNIERLRKCYEVNPNATFEELDLLVSRLEGTSYEKKDGIAIVTIDRPEALNALNSTVILFG